MPVKLYFAKFLYLFGVSRTKYSLLKFLVKWAKYIPICRSVLNRSLAFDFIQTGIKKNISLIKDTRLQAAKIPYFNLLQLFLGSILMLLQLSPTQGMSLELITASEVSNGLISKY